MSPSSFTALAVALPLATLVFCLSGALVFGARRIREALDARRCKARELRKVRATAAWPRPAMRNWAKRNRLPAHARPSELCRRGVDPRAFELPPSSSVRP